jgi:hypothetical protein
MARLGCRHDQQFRAMLHKDVERTRFVKGL